jgi:hypothetical protein
MDVTGLPEYLRKRQRVVRVSRERLCPGPHPDPETLAAIGGYDCPHCHGAGVVPRPATDRGAVGVEPLPDDHDARTHETWIPGFDDA